MRIPALLLITLSLIVITGCRTVMVVPATPRATIVVSHPPHAPAHGYRHHYHGHDLEYDSSLGAYFVLGYDGVYFYNDLYLRFYAGDWQVVDRLDGRWRRAEHRHVPSRLWRDKRYKRHSRYAPPPHAPAHGYRHHHRDGVDLVFDSGIGAYIVLGFDDLFFFDGHYMRYHDNRWHIADRHDGRWRRADDRHVPRKLRHTRKAEKQGLFKRIKNQYREEHREEREYRERHYDSRDRYDNRSNRRYDHRDKDRGKDRDRNRARSDHRDRDKDRDRDRSRSDNRDRDNERESKGGLLSKVKKKHDDKAREENSKSDRDDDRDDDRRDRRDNGYRF